MEGRLTREKRVLDGFTYPTQTSYDALDRVHQLTYPDNEALTHSYGANGLLNQMTSSLGTTLVSGTQYNALQRVSTTRCSSPRGIRWAAGRRPRCGTPTTGRTPPVDPMAR